MEHADDQDRIVADLVDDLIRKPVRNAAAQLLSHARIDVGIAADAAYRGVDPSRKTLAEARLLSFVPAGGGEYLLDSLRMSG